MRRPGIVALALTAVLASTGCGEEASSSATPDADLDASLLEPDLVVDFEAAVDLDATVDDLDGVVASEVVAPETDAPIADVARDVAVDVARDVAVDRPAPLVDNDGDGYRSNVDCNDRNIRVHPGAVDLCGDGVDQNCDGRDASCTCAKRLHVLVDDYGSVDGPGLEGRSNGCWEVHSVNDRVPLEFRHCIHGTNSGYECGGHIRQIAGANWYYDDTNTAHGASDATLIRQCATRCGASATPVGAGFVTMAASGGWRYESGGIAPVNFIAQLYTSASNEALQSGLVAAWASARRAAPQVSFTHATAAQMSAWTTQVCGRLNSGNWIAFYVGSGRNGGAGPLQADDYVAWSRALNACTR